MKPPISLISLWFDRPPAWIDDYAARMLANRSVKWQLISAQLTDVNDRAAQVAGVPCRKATPYSTCDLRPLFGRMYEAEFKRAKWWGWCDLDVCVGNLDKMLAPLLDHYDIITTDPWTISGPLTIFRNCPETLDLWRSGPYAEVLADPDYCNWDETGYGVDVAHPRNPSLTQLVQQSKFRVRYDDRIWTESHHVLPNGAPARVCRLDQGGGLREVPTGRELLLYHFSLPPKRWPLPTVWGSAFEAQCAALEAYKPAPRTSGEESPEHWSGRVRRALAEDLPPHRIMIDTPEGDWVTIQEHTARVLKVYLRDDDHVLDAGCGWGGLLDCLSIAGLKVFYTGVDYCPELVAMAHGRWPRQAFAPMDLRSLSYNGGTFDWAVCRAVEGSVKTLVSLDDWRQMEREMRRVAKRVLVMDYSGNYRVLEPK